MGETPRDRTGRQTDADLDGVVLFDPGSRDLSADSDPEREPFRFGPIVVLLLVLATGGGGTYWAYAARRAVTPTSAEGPVVPPEQPQGGGGLIPLGGGGLIGAVGAALPFEVRAVGPGGFPLVDTIVRFTIDGLDASLDPEAPRTDSEGIARTSVRLPSRSGRGTIRAELHASDLSTEVLLAARAGAPTRIGIVQGNGQEGPLGELLPTRLTVSVFDEAGNPVPDAAIEFSIATGGGVVAPTGTRTDSVGVASALWRLGPAAGAQEARAVALDLGQGVTFSANGVGRIVAGVGTGVSVAPTPVRAEPHPYSIGGSHACALDGGAAVCRGANDRGQALARAGSGFVALAAGISHTCALDAAGVATCWGANNSGQLGDGSTTDRVAPTPVRTELRFSTLSAGATHTCALAAEGLPVCWGENLSGQLGDGSRTDARFPRAVGGGLSLRAIVAGWSHTCGLTASGNAFCWGLNTDGQLGDGSRLDRLVPTLVSGSIESLAAGSAHTCGVSGTQVLCWGDNRFGQIGDGTNETRAQPVAVEGLSGTIRQVVSGAVHACALQADGSAYCWGQNLHGQLGDGTRENRNRATRVAGGHTFRSIEAGGALTCGFTTDGAELCWGLNQNGQLGDGTRESRPLPTRVTR